MCQYLLLLTSISATLAGPLPPAARWNESNMLPDEEGSLAKKVFRDIMKPACLFNFTSIISNFSHQNDSQNDPVDVLKESTHDDMKNGPSMYPLEWIIYGAVILTSIIGILSSVKEQIRTKIRRRYLESKPLEKY
ncbi:unnamed protein product [Nezara viridula]|uniref:Neuropeptide n=1 Tax=Nezara viridula TaxID=85310 RepID=A0A9P0EGC2_NEZVI|nr:unnamed protein product [Nezara viridula]